MRGGVNDMRGPHLASEPSDICALAENVVVVLVGRDSRGRDWEARGFWRWERVVRSRGAAATGRKAFFELTQGGLPRRIPPAEWPFAWRAVSPSSPRPPAEIVTRPKVECPEPRGELDWLAERVDMAFKVDRALPDRERGQLRARTWWPETRPGPGDYPPEMVTRFRPSPRDVDQYIETMGWVAALEKSQIRVLRLRALGCTFRTIAEKVHTHEADARRAWRQALLDLHAVSRGSRRQKRRTRGRAQHAAC